MLPLRQPTAALTDEEADWLHELDLLSFKARVKYPFAGMAPLSASDNYNRANLFLADVFIPTFTLKSDFMCQDIFAIIAIVAPQRGPRSSRIA